MTGQELAAIRRRAGLGVADFGVALGLKGALSTVARLARRMERVNVVPDEVARAAAWLEKTAQKGRS